MRTVVINALNLGKFHRYWLEHFQLRRRIFVERLEWDLPEDGDLEFDSFDTPAAHYVVALDEDDHVCALSRLVPTTSPYMIETLWPEWPGPACPKSPKIWEATRFGCSAELNAAQRKDAISSLFRTIYEFGQNRDLDHFLMVMPQFIFERLIRRAGYDVDYIGDARKFDGVPTRLGRVNIAQAQMPHMPVLRPDYPATLLHHNA
ncbi:acyl-homoserine-lactone synthase [Thioclava sp. FTW29]|uniref:Acyl-homoserine-lactone synthase n=1 Tax=Thioclava litoralis TaxID=3076557 RepID=A0ABZ1E677_9RHOB|nr:acyl-homoserine-lactone synthase [Thioclava sp. FTW29]